MEIRAFILAAGRGKRLGVLTRDRPKVLLSLKNGFTFLDYHVCLLRRFAGLRPRDIVVIAGHGAEAVVEKAHRHGIQVIVNEFYDRFENMYSVYVTDKLLGDADGYIVLNGDTLVHPCILVGLIDMFRARNACRTAVLAIDSLKRLGWEEMKVVIEEGRVRRLGKDIDPARASGEYIGLSIFSSTAYKRFIEALGEQVGRGATNVWYEIVLNNLIDEINILPFYIGSLPWIEVDTIDDYRAALKLFKDILETHVEGCSAGDRRGGRSEER